MSKASGAAREAFARADWDDAYALLSAADSRSPLPLEDLERLATAAYLHGRDDSSIDAWTRAHRMALAQGEPERAVRCAFWVGFGLIQRGDMAQAGGWMTRASELVGAHRADCVERGYLLVPGALANLGGGAHQVAFDQFAEAGAVADRFDDADLRALSRLGRGQALFRLGRAEDGTTLFDAAMTAVTAGEVSPVISGIVYCAVVDECHQAFDVERAREWTRALSRWCGSQPGLVPYRGQCLVHRSQVLQLQGAWPEALEEAQRAQRRLSEPPHPAVGMAHYQLGELCRLRGDLDEAVAAYQRAQECGCPPEPGLALARLAQGDVAAAAAAIDAAVAEARDTVTSARRLPAFVEIMLVAGRVERARQAADRLASIAAKANVAFLAATAAHADGTVLLAEGDPRAAIARLRWAWEQWRGLEAPYEVARTQVQIGRACQELGANESARLECDSARHAFARLGATADLEHIRQIIGSVVADVGDDVLTPREIQVLRRVARGLTNREIADELFISVKTVERHLSNMFVKLDASNRTQATAIAHDRNLL